MNFLYLRINFLVACFAAFGSLYFSEILKFPPCVLCWYQRIFLYPLVIVFCVALWFEDRTYVRYSIPMALAGLLIAGYHNLLYYDVIPEALTPCTQGISCSSRQLELLGFITIPLLSFFSFLAILLLTMMDRPSIRGNYEK